MGGQQRGEREVIQQSRAKVGGSGGKSKWHSQPGMDPLNEIWAESRDPS